MITANIRNRNASRRVYGPLYAPSSANLSKQGKQVLALISRDGKVTRLTALHYGIANLTAHITELRYVGFNVVCEVKQDANGKEYGCWSIGD